MAKARIQRLRKYLPVSQNHLKGGPIPNVMEWEEPLEFSDVLTLSSNLKEAMEMMLQIDEIEKEFPGLDCGACGAPTCRAFAEDVVKGICKDTECIFVYRNRMKKVASTLSELEESMGRFSREDAKEEKEERNDCKGNGRRLRLDPAGRRGRGGQPDRRLLHWGPLSWVMARAQSGNVWITVMGNVNAIAVATLTDVSCIVLTENAAPGRRRRQQSGDAGHPCVRLRDQQLPDGHPGLQPAAMNTYHYDLHIHSCLSPCGDNDMTPNNLVQMALLSGCDVIALTDHNTCRNAPAAMEAGARNGLLVIPGMELCTAEEAHVVCLFETLEGALEFDHYIYENMPHVKNRPEIFGEQRLLDGEDGPVGRRKTCCWCPPL